MEKEGGVLARDAGAGGGEAGEKAVHAAVAALAATRGGGARDAAKAPSGKRGAKPPAASAKPPATSAKPPAAAAKPPPGEVRRDWTLTDFSGSPGFVAPEMVTDESYDGRYVDAWSLGCLVLELVVGHGTFDHVWMSAYSHDTMADRDAFARALANALRLLRALPQFRAPAAALADPTAEAPLQLNALGGFLFALLEVPPTKRADIRRVHTHPWLATVEARESALARAEAVACGDAAHLDAAGCVLTSASEISA